MQLSEASAAFRELGVEEYELRFTCNIPIEEEGTLAQTSERIYRTLQRFVHLSPPSLTASFFFCTK